MKQGLAFSILITMALGLFGFVGAAVFNHESRISKNETMKDILKEIRQDTRETRQDIKFLLKEKH